MTAMFEALEAPRRVASGRRVINILFLCLARDCEETISTFFSYLACLEENGFRCSAIIGENGSRDNTRILIEEATHQRIELLDTSFMSREASRLARMAIGRQALLDKTKERDLEADFICVSDLDNVMIAPPAPSNVRMAIERLAKDDGLFAVGATSRPVYYDLLALRAKDHNYSTLNSEIIEAKKRPLSYFRFHQRRIQNNQRLMTRREPIPCISSFNGFCIYNAKDYRLGTYRAPDEADVCEHVTLNQSIARATGKSMVVAPELILQTPADHAPLDFCSFWVQRIGRGAWRLLQNWRGKRVLSQSLK